jgi:hypothetical protein
VRLKYATALKITNSQKAGHFDNFTKHLKGNFLVGKESMSGEKMYRSPVLYVTALAASQLSTN